MAAQGQAGEAGQAQQGEVQGGDQGALHQGLEALTQRFDQFQQGLEPMQQYLQQLQGGQQEQAGQQQEGQEPGLDVGELEANFGLDREGAEQLAGVLQQHTAQQVESAVQKAIAPLQERLSELQWNHDASQIAAEIPDLQQPEKAQQVMDAAGQIAEAIGSPQLATHPLLVKTVAYGMIGMQLQQERQQDGADAPNAGNVEGGGGAAPAQPAQADQFERFFGNQQRQHGNLGAAALPYR